MTKKFIIISALLVFILTPFTAWVIVASNYSDGPNIKTPSLKVTPATREQLLKAVTTKQKQDLHVHQVSGTDSRVVGIVSYENLNTWWYIVKVKYEIFGEENPIAQPMLVVKYYDGPDTIAIVTSPGEPLQFHNMSNSSGVPYDVIDKYNLAIIASQPQLGEEN